MTHEIGTRHFNGHKTHEITDATEHGDGLVSYYGCEVKADGSLGQEIALWWLDEVIA